MSTYKTITQLSLPENNRHLVRNKQQYIAFDKVWKQLVAEDVERKTTRSDFASLLILRNILLNRDVTMGFTPYLQYNSLKNGRGFIDGFSNAINRLRGALSSSTVTALQTSSHRLLLSIAPYPSTKELVDILPRAQNFHTEPYMNNVTAQVQKMLVEQHEQGDSIQHQSYQQIFDVFDRKD